MKLPNPITYEDGAELSSLYDNDDSWTNAIEKYKQNPYATLIKLTTDGELTLKKAKFLSVYLNQITNFIIDESQK